MQAKNRGFHYVRSHFPPGAVIKKNPRAARLLQTNGERICERERTRNAHQAYNMYPCLGTTAKTSDENVGDNFFRRLNFFSTVLLQKNILRGTILNRTYGRHKNLHISLFLPTRFGPIYYGPRLYLVLVLLYLVSTVALIPSDVFPKRKCQCQSGD